MACRGATADQGASVQAVKRRLQARCCLCERGVAATAAASDALKSFRVYHKRSCMQHVRV